MQQQQQQYVVTSQPVPGVLTAQTITVGKEPLRSWSSGLCDCCQDCKSCALTTFFPFCYLCCCLSERMGEHCCTPCLLPESVVMAYRLKLRTKYNIKGTIIGDGCCSYWCTLCIICQIARELNHIESEIGGPAFTRDK